jgi:hypothetical protein
VLWEEVKLSSVGTYDAGAYDDALPAAVDGEGTDLDAVLVDDVLHKLFTLLVSRS